MCGGGRLWSGCRFGGLGPAPLGAERLSYVCDTAVNFRRASAGFLQGC